MTLRCTVLVWVFAVGCSTPVSDELAGGRPESGGDEISNGTTLPSRTNEEPSNTPSNPGPGLPTPSGPRNPGTVACGTDSCNLATEICCSTLDVGGGGCLPADQPCIGAKITCDDSTDCPANQRCCGGFFGAACAPSCESMSPTQLCNTTAECGAAGACTEKQCSKLNGSPYTIRSCGAPPLGCS